MTERLALERKIEEEKALLQAVLNNLPDAIFLKDREGRFILANNPLADLMQAPSVDSVVGKTDRDFYPQEMAREFAADERRIFDEGVSLINKEEPKTVEGKTRSS